MDSIVKNLLEKEQNEIRYVYNDFNSLIFDTCIARNKIRQIVSIIIDQFNKRD